MGNNIKTKHATLALTGAWQRLSTGVADYRIFFAGIELKTTDLSAFKVKNGATGAEYTVNANTAYAISDRENDSCFKEQDLYVLGTAGKTLELEIWLYEFQN